MSDDIIDAEVVGETPPPPRRDSNGNLVPFTKQVGADDGGLSISDSRILALAVKGKSMEEIGRELGIPPLRVVARLKEIIRSRRVLSIEEREELVLQEVIDLKEDVKSIIANAKAAGELGAIDPRMLTTLNNIFKTMLATFDGRRKALADKRMTLTEGQAAIVNAALSAIFDVFFRDVLAGLDVDELEAREVLEGAIPRGIAIIQRSTEEPEPDFTGD